MALAIACGGGGGGGLATAEQAAPIAAEVRPAVDGQPLIAFKEHCSVDPDRLAAIGAAAGRQVRVYRDPATFALFTAEARDEEPETIVRMGEAARRRFGGTEGFEATISPDVTHSELTDAEADALGELVERLDDDGEQTGLLIMAPHGGEIEAETGRQAGRLRARLGGDRASTWIVKGFDPPGPQTAFGRWHITSTDIHEASYPMLGRVAARRFDHAISFHGMASEKVLIGGAGPLALKLEIQAALREAVGEAGVEVVIAQPGQANGGSSPANIVNRYCRGTGIQVEQGPAARRDHWREIADAIAEVYRRKL